MAKLYIHIGLPKTATTALQQGFFPFITSESLCYVGVLQPRSSAQNPLYESFYRAVNRGGASIDLARHEIEGKLRAGQSLIFSEEMILFSQPQADWRDKLAHLYALVQGLDYVLILTVREPVGALFSYYVEVLPTILKEAGKLEDDAGFMARAKSDPMMEIFHYKKLMEELGRRFELSRIFIKQFEQIIKGDLGDILRLFDLPQDFAPAILPVENRRTEIGGYVYTGQMITLGDLLRARCGRSKLRSKVLRRFLYRLCDPLSEWLKIKLRVLKVKRPGAQEMDELKHYLQLDNDWLAHKHGVDYRSE